MANSPALTPHSAPQVMPTAGRGAARRCRASTRKYSASNIRNTANTMVSTRRSSPPTRDSVTRLARPKAMVGGSTSRHRTWCRYFQNSTMQNSWLMTMASAGASTISKKNGSTIIRKTTEPKPVTDWMIPATTLAAATMHQIMRHLHRIRSPLSYHSAVKKESVGREKTASRRK